MKINSKILLLYDVETLPNVFTVTLCNSETEGIATYQISNIRDDTEEIIKLFKRKDVIFVGYNNKAFDDIVIQQLLDYGYNKWDSSLKYHYIILTKMLYNKAQSLISREEGFIKEYSKLDSIDLMTMLFSNKLRVSLKNLEMTLEFDNVQEFEFDFQRNLPDEDIPKLISYNENDVRATLCLLKKVQKDLLFKLDIEKQYGIKATSKDNMKIGIAILEKYYCEAVKITPKELSNIQTANYTHIKLNECVLPFIKFTDNNLSELLQNVKNGVLTLNEKGHVEGLDYNVLFGNKQYDIGMGGLHSVDHPGIITPKSDEKLIDADVGSYYPSMIIKHGFIPKHLGRSFARAYEDIYIQRLTAKRDGNKTVAESLKLSLNGTYGNLINKHSWLYDPKAAMKVTINGQLMLLMLIESLTSIGCSVVSANTDGITTIVPLTKESDYYRSCKAWEDLTRMGLEYVEYETLIQRDVNSYIALKSGYRNAKTDQEKENLRKLKGYFVDKAQLGKGLSPNIIPIALFKYFVDDVPVRETIKNHTDIKDFLMSQGVGREFIVKWKGIKQQRNNRFYACTDNTGGRIQKCKGDSIIDIVADSSVEILNKFDSKSINERNINYGWYIKQCNELIEKIKPTQLKLF